MTPTTIERGQPFPLGATPRTDGERPGVNFAVYSEHAHFIELCVFDAAGAQEVACHRLPVRTDGVWHGFLPGAGAGFVYGYRAHGPYQPDAGHRFNPHKLLLDPYAREIVGRFAWRDEHLGYQHEHGDRHPSFDRRDNASLALKARVAAPSQQAAAPRPDPIPAADTVLYELHVKGFTRLHDGVPRHLRGTFAGLAHPAAIEPLRALGVTTICLQPVHYALSEKRLLELGLVNYWGYNTIGFFCPDPRLSSTPDDPTATRAEFRTMVDALHAAGLEVLIDVVFNHTAEGNETGPTLSFRGLDNATYYGLQHDDRARYSNITGCGNTVNVAHPRVTQLVLDSLRYWIEAMGVDGFRFDLAPVLGRTRHGFDSYAAFFVALLQDPVLARAKLVAEPWDIGPGGYQLGRFPPRFLEWNDRFRDGMRQFWLQRTVDRAEFACRLLASSDRFHHGLRTPASSVNYIAAHDGPTLHDLVTYAAKRNHANGESNRDGHANDHSTNCGIEGETADPAINARRARLKRALLATMLLAQGTPMLLAGDEGGRTQRGNNNAYCQDNEISWLDWERTDLSLRGFVAHVIALRKRLHAVLDSSWFTGHAHADGNRDVVWIAPAGHEMRVEDWHDPARHCLGMRLAKAGEASALLLFNAEPTGQAFRLPVGAWRRLLDSSTATQSSAAAPVAGDSLEVPAESVLVLIA